MEGKIEIAYILQIITIIITVALGMVTYFQNKKLQHGQNIIAITTTYRIKRSEQLKDCTERILTNTNPELLKLKCDIYTSAEWRRAKNETKGENTSAESWFKDYYELEEGFLNDFESLKLKYNK